MKETVFKYLNRNIAVEKLTILESTHILKNIDGGEVLYPYQLMEEIQLVFGVTPYGAKKYGAQWLREVHDIFVNDKYWLGWGKLTTGSLITTEPLRGPNVGFNFLDMVGASGNTAMEGVVLKPRSIGISTNLHASHVRTYSRDIKIIGDLE